MRQISLLFGALGVVACFPIFLIALMACTTGIADTSDVENRQFGVMVAGAGTLILTVSALLIRFGGSSADR